MSAADASPAPLTAAGWLDISVPLHNGMVTWPGDPPFQRHFAEEIERGDAANVSHLSLGAHTGTHMDAPLHFIPGAATLDQLPLEAVIGPARVLAIRDRAAITPDELREHRIQAGERLLFKTVNSQRCWSLNEFVEDFVFITYAAAEYLAQCRVRLVGVDYLSVGGFHKDGAETHRALLGAGIWIIEGLNLASVEAGDYDLICLPLKLMGAEGGPARALLRPRVGQHPGPRTGAQKPDP